MNTAIILASLFAGISALTAPPITGTTPPAIDCPNTLCENKEDGNYGVGYHPNYFVQCFGGLADCQACWPLSLTFVPRCNQCLYTADSACATTEKWEPATTFQCPDLCPKYGPEYTGNINDPSEKRQYVACWQGVTVGCVACPSGLEFNEKENACLYKGKYITAPKENWYLHY